MHESLPDRTRGDASANGWTPNAASRASDGPVSLSRRAFVGVLLACASALILPGCKSGGSGGSTGSTGSYGSSTSVAAGQGIAACPAALDGITKTDTIPGEIPTSAYSNQELSTTLFAFDTVVTMRACCSQATLDAAADRCAYFESIFSRTIATSDIGRINAAGGAAVQVSVETADIISKALQYCELSGGSFDITIGAASELWDFKQEVVPAASDLAEAVKHIDYSKVVVDGNKVRLLDPAAKLDLGGIAKGYIADDLARLFIDAGCDSACINLGGNVKTVGVRPDGKQWMVGVQDPNDQGNIVIGKTPSHDSSVVTSGLYERQFQKDGTRYWHILDPKTGYPVQTDLVSATVISDASLDGDGFTKPLFMMGAQAAIDFLDATEGLAGIVQTADGTILETRDNPVELLA